LVEFIIHASQAKKKPLPGLSQWMLQRLLPG